MDEGVDDKQNDKSKTRQKFSDDGTYTFFWLVVHTQLVTLQVFCNTAAEGMIYNGLYSVSTIRIIFPLHNISLHVLNLTDCIIRNFQYLHMHVYMAVMGQ